MKEPNNMGAKFEADSAFLIKGRGLILAGWILDGMVKTGMVALIPSFPRKLVIQGIEMIHTTELRKGVVGLRFPLGSEQDISIWKALVVKGQVINIE
jgi:hypothetical protein